MNAQSSTDSHPDDAAAGAPKAAARSRSSIALWVAGLALALLAGWLIGRSSNASRIHSAPADLEAATPAAAAVTATTAPASASEVERAHGSAAAELPAGVAAALEALRQRVAEAPEDLAARKELAVRLTEAGLLVEAFEHAEAVLAVEPDDADSLYVEGEVRLAMGQGQRAAELLDRVLVQHPDHLMALIARGRASSLLGDRDGAIGRWQRALAVAGGRYPPVEALLAEVGAEGAAGGLKPLSAAELEQLSGQSPDR